MTATNATNAVNAEQGTNFIAKTADNANKPLIVKNAAGDIVGYFDANGFQAIRYRDEYPSGVWQTPTGANAPDRVSVTLGAITYDLLAFDGGTTEEKQTNQFEITHDLALAELNAGTLKLEFHAHILPSSSNAGTARLFIDYAYLAKDAAPVAQTSVFFDFTTNTEQYFHKVAGVEIAKPAAGFNIGDMIVFQLRRTPTNASDTYPDDIYLLQCAMHVPTNDFGSRQRYIK